MALIVVYNFIFITPEEKKNEKNSFAMSEIKYKAGKG
jgi:hypothetical protein